MAAEIVKLISTLITAATVVGFDETTLRSGPAGEKKFVHGAFTERYSAVPAGRPVLDSMKDFGILADFAGIVVSDRYGNYFHPTWKNISGHQACVPHLLRDLQDCAGNLPRNDLARPGARRAPRADPRPQPASDQGLDAIPAAIREPARAAVPPRHHRRLAGVPRIPGPRNSTKQQPGRDCSNSAATVKPTS